MPQRRQEANFENGLQPRSQEIVDQADSSCAIARPEKQSPFKAYTYTPLIDPSKDFRLVTLHPALEESNNIECLLQHGHLSDPGEFEALSYA